MPKIKGRGSNPNSHGNNKKLPGEKITFRKVGLYPWQWEFVEKAGGRKGFSYAIRKQTDLFRTVAGDNADKILAQLFHSTDQDRLLARSTTFTKVVTLVEQVAASDSPLAQQAQALLDELDGLEIEESFKDAVIDGAVTPIQGAWIV